MCPHRVVGLGRRRAARHRRPALDPRVCGEPLGLFAMRAARLRPCAPGIGRLEVAQRLRRVGPQQPLDLTCRFGRQRLEAITAVCGFFCCAAGRQPRLAQGIVDLDEHLRQLPEAAILAEPRLRLRPGVGRDDACDRLAGLLARQRQDRTVPGVALCSASTTLAGRVASFEDVTRLPQEDRTDGFQAGTASCPTVEIILSPCRLGIGVRVRGAAVKAVSPAKRGRSAATRLDGGEHRRRLSLSDRGVIGHSPAGRDRPSLGSIFVRQRHPAGSIFCEAMRPRPTGKNNCR